VVPRVARLLRSSSGCAARASRIVAAAHGAQAAPRDVGSIAQLDMIACAVAARVS